MEVNFGLLFFLTAALVGGLPSGHGQTLPSRVIGDPNDVRFGLEIELTHSRTLGNFLKFAEIVNVSPELKGRILSRAIMANSVESYLSNVENFEALPEDLQTRLTKDLRIPPKPDLLSPAPAAIVVPDFKIHLRPSRPALPGGKIELPESQPVPEIPMHRPLELPQTRTQSVLIGDAEERRSFWGEIRQRWEALPLEEKIQAIDLNRLHPYDKANLFLTRLLDNSHLAFKTSSGLPAEDIELLKDIEIGEDTRSQAANRDGATIEIKYKPNSAIHGVEEHDRRLRLVGRMAGILRPLENPQLPLTEVVKTDIDANLKGFAFHFHASQKNGEPITREEVVLIQLLARLRALKKDHFERVFESALQQERDPNFFENSSYEWRSHSLSPREEAQIIREVLRRDHKNRDRFLRQAILSEIADPLVRKRLHAITTPGNKRALYFLERLIGRNVARILRDSQSRRAFLIESAEEMLRQEASPESFDRIEQLLSLVEPEAYQHLVQSPLFVRRVKEFLGLNRDSWSDTDREIYAKRMSKLPMTLLEKFRNPIQALALPEHQKMFRADPEAALEKLAASPELPQLFWTDFLSQIRRSRDVTFRQRGSLALLQQGHPEDINGTLQGLLTETEYRRVWKDFLSELPAKNLLTGSGLISIIIGDPYLASLWKERAQEVIIRPRKDQDWVRFKIWPHFFRENPHRLQMDTLLASTAANGQETLRSEIARAILDVHWTRWPSILKSYPEWDFLDMLNGTARHAPSLRSSGERGELLRRLLQKNLRSSALKDLFATSEITPKLLAVAHEVDYPLVLLPPETFMQIRQAVEKAPADWFIRKKPMDWNPADLLLEELQYEFKQWGRSKFGSVNEDSLRAVKTIETFLELSQSAQGLRQHSGGYGPKWTHPTFQKWIAPLLITYRDRSSLAGRLASAPGQVADAIRAGLFDVDLRDNALLQKVIHDPLPVAALELHELWKELPARNQAAVLCQLKNLGQTIEPTKYLTIVATVMREISPELFREISQNLALLQFFMETRSLDLRTNRAHRLALGGQIGSTLSSLRFVRLSPNVQEALLRNADLVPELSRSFHLPHTPQLDAAILAYTQTLWARGNKIVLRELLAHMSEVSETSLREIPGLREVHRAAHQFVRNHREEGDLQGEIPSAEFLVWARRIGADTDSSRSFCDQVYSKQGLR